MRGIGGKKRRKYLDKAGLGEIESEDKDLEFYCKNLLVCLNWYVCVCAE